MTIKITNPVSGLTEYSSDTIVGCDFAGFDPGDCITVGNGDSSDGVYTITSTGSSYITIKDMYQTQIDELNEKFDKIMERLGILDDPDPEQLEKNKSLKKAYEKYKMLEKLAGASDD